MRLPHVNASPHDRVEYGRYVARRCRRAGLAELADGALAASAALRDAARAVEDAGDPVQDGLADRDAADDDLDDHAQEIRLGLASRSVSAARERPYTDVFPKGIDHYLAAPIGQQVARYSELADRLDGLPETDAARPGAAVIRTGLAAWEAALVPLTEARTALSIARTARDAATDDWSRQMERTYGALVERLGKRRAERFFPRHRTARSEAPEGGGDPD
jgi:hypothetical protein